MTLRRVTRWSLVVVAGLVAAACADPSFGANQAANALFAAGQYQQALDAYRAIQQQRPDLPQVAVNAGNALHMLKEYGRSLDEYARALSTDDRDVAARAAYNRGNSLFRLDRLDEAREAYKDALRVDPNDRDAKFNIEVVDRIQEQRRQQQQGGEGNPEGQQGDGQNPPDPNQEGPGGQGQPGQGQQPPDQQPGGQGQPGQGQQPPNQQPGQGQQPPPQNQPGQQPGAPGGPGGGQPGPPPSVPQALDQFRQNLSPEEAMRLLDALLHQQRGLRGLIEGQPRLPPGQRGQPQPPSPLY